MLNDLTVLNVPACPHSASATTLADGTASQSQPWSRRSAQVTDSCLCLVSLVSLCSSGLCLAYLDSLGSPCLCLVLLVSLCSSGLCLVYLDSLGSPCLCLASLGSLCSPALCLVSLVFLGSPDLCLAVPQSLGLCVSPFSFQYLFFSLTIRFLCSLYYRQQLSERSPRRPVAADGAPPKDFREWMQDRDALREELSTWRLKAEVGAVCCSGIMGVMAERAQR